MDINAEKFSEIAARAIQPIILSWLRQMYIRGQNDMRQRCVDACAHKLDAEKLKGLRVETFNVVGRPTLRAVDAATGAQAEGASDTRRATDA